MTPQLPQWLLSMREINQNGCWIWKGGKVPLGYGATRWYDGKKRLVHRIVAHIVHKIDLNDPKIEVAHSCDIPACFNPDHLKPGSHADNMKDVKEKGLMLRKECRRGHELKEGNLHFNSRGERQCLTCFRMTHNRLKGYRFPK